MERIKHSSDAAKLEVESSGVKGVGEAAAKALAPFVARHQECFREVVRSGRVRLLALEPLDGRLLPGNWAWPITADEVVLRTAPMVRGTRHGLAALVVDRAALPHPHIDDATLDHVASSLADALIAEVA